MIWFGLINDPGSSLCPVEVDLVKVQPVRLIVFVCGFAACLLCVAQTRERNMWLALPGMQPKPTGVPRVNHQLLFFQCCNWSVWLFDCGWQTGGAEVCKVETQCFEWRARGMSSGVRVGAATCTHRTGICCAVRLFHSCVRVSMCVCLKHKRCPAVLLKLVAMVVNSGCSQFNMFWLITWNVGLCICTCGNISGDLFFVI